MKTCLTLIAGIAALANSQKNPEIPVIEPFSEGK
jgi:hypothetical protein